MFLSVVSPPGSPRRQAMERQLDQLGMSPDGFFGVMGDDLEDEWIARHVDQRSAIVHQGVPLTPRQVGCYVGHRQAWRASLVSGAEWGVVLEDDALLLPTFDPVLTALNRLKWQEPVVVSFLSTGRHIVRRRRPDVKLGNGVVLRQLRWPPNSAVGYAMNRGAMELRLEREGKISTPVDWPPWSAYVRFWITVPWIVEHSPGPSMVDPDGISRTSNMGRMLSKAVGWRFITAPRSYYWSPQCYWRHTYAPTMYATAHEIVARLAASTTAGDRDWP
jgi:glycosyl transferase family 25